MAQTETSSRGLSREQIQQIRQILKAVSPATTQIVVSLAQPVPEDFGIASAELPALRARHKQASKDRAFSHWLVAWLIPAGGIATLCETVSLEVLWLLLFPMTLVVAYYVASTAKGAFDWLCPLTGFEALNEYEKAFTQWLNAQKKWQEAERRACAFFWQNLSSDGIAFEQELASLYRALGYAVEDTPRTCDNGVDLLLQKDERRLAVQCKYLSKPIGVKAARELIGAAKIAGADEAVLAGVSGFTQGVRAYAEQGHIQLLGLQGILSMQKTVLNKLRDDAVDHAPTK